MKQAFFLLLCLCSAAGYANSLAVDDPQFFKKLVLPADFIFGVADSAYQTEGAQGPEGKLYANNWTSFDQEHDLVSADRGCERWTRYAEDIALMAACGFKLYRFSIEWSKIEPEAGIFNQAALAHYKQVCQELLERGIRPQVCFFHHTWPCWFGQQGGFEKPENTRYFLRYAQRVVQELSPYVDFWMTFNEPEGYAMQGYGRGKYPPGKKSLKLAGEVLKNMLSAHVELYALIKKEQPRAQVGFAHIVQPVEPYTWYNPLDKLACHVANNLMQESVLQFFMTGYFSWSTLGLQSVTGYDARARKSLDYLAINYYTHTWLKNFAPAAKKAEQKSDDGKAIYPQGLYEALEQYACLGVPLYVAENGIADRADRFRAAYIKEHLAQVSKACCAGIPVRGYCYWTFMDCHEWGQPLREAGKKPAEQYAQCYGLIAVNKKTQERTVRNGAQEFIAFVQSRA